MIELQELGWDSYFAQQLAALQQPAWEAGRVVAEDRRVYTVLTQSGEVRAEAAGKLLYTSGSVTDLPKVGDWVALTVYPSEGKGIMQAVLTRRSKFSRKVPGKLLDEQILATNVDVLFIVQGLDANFSLRRLERYLTMAWEGGVQPVVVLNKTDVCSDLQQRMAEVLSIAGEAAVVATSAATGSVEPLRAFLRPGLTFALVGSSGVGKSTILNTLAGQDIQTTFEVNEKGDRGRHTTTRRELIVMPDGSLLIDTPGMRELQLWDADEGLSETFSDIENLATNCRFSDCTHTHEAKCAVREAVDRGEVSEERYRSYLKLNKEMSALHARQEKSAHQAKKTRMKTSTKEYDRIAGEQQ